MFAQQCGPRRELPALTPHCLWFCASIRGLLVLLFLWGSSLGQRLILLLCSCKTPTASLERVGALRILSVVGFWEFFLSLFWRFFSDIIYVKLCKIPHWVFLNMDSKMGQLTPESLQGKRMRALLPFPSPSQHTFLLRTMWFGGREGITRACFASYWVSEEIWMDFWVHICFFFTVKVFFSISQPPYHCGHSIFFLPLVNLTYCQVYFYGFSGLGTTAIRRKRNNCLGLDEGLVSGAFLGGCFRLLGCSLGFLRFAD